MHLRSRGIAYYIPPQGMDTTKRDAGRVYGRLVAGQESAQDAYDHLATEYDSAYLSPKDLAENSWLSRYLIRKDYGSGFVLDVGCGTGLLIDLCPVDPESYVGIDVSDRMIETARKKYPELDFRKGAMESLESVVPESSVDNAIYLFGSFAYAIDQPAALRSLAYALKPGGRFFIMALSHRYPDRASYSVANAGYSVPINTYDSEDLFDLFYNYGAFSDLQVRGLSLAVDGLNWLGPRLLDKWYRLDAVIGTFAPEAGAYVCIEGRLA